jgi:hypothetical protein
LGVATQPEAAAEVATDASESAEPLSSEAMPRLDEGQAPIDQPPDTDVRSTAAETDREAPQSAEPPSRRKPRFRWGRKHNRSDEQDSLPGLEQDR